jgi:hypothetical protein
LNYNKNNLFFIMPKFENSYIWVSDLIAEEYRPSAKIEFPFQTIFASEPVKIFLPEEKDLTVAKAGIDSLKPFLDSSIDLEKNYDLIGVAFNAFVVNRANKNGQVISTDVALSSVENFKFKPMNIEHKRKNVAGLITSYGFSEYGTDKPLSLEEVKDKKEPFNVVLSGFVWRVVNEEFAEKLEASSDPSSESYLTISTSWEMGFKNFNIAKGSLNLSEASIISDENAVSEMKNKLMHFGGNGLADDGQPVYINLVGEVLPLGIGFTNNPAADVKGVKVFGSDDLEDKQEVSEDVASNTKEVAESSQLEEKLVETNIISNKLDTDNLAAASNSFEKEINKKENNKMLIKSIQDLTDDSLKQICATDIRSLFEEEIKKAGEKFAEAQEAKDKLVAEAEKTKAELEAQLEELKQTGEQLKAELEKIRVEAEAREKEESFQNRMTTLDEEFSLDDEERQVIGEQIKDLDQEAFDKWYKAFNVFAKSKNKKLMMEKKEAEEKNKEKEETKAASVEEKESAEAIASEQEKEQEIANMLEKAEAEEVALPNGAVAEDSLRQKFAKAFNSNTIKVENK